MRRHRVVVTGVGVVSSIGTGASAFTAALRAGRSGASTIRAFDTKDFPSDQACEVRDFEPQRWVTRLDVSAIGRTSQLAIAASHLAVEDAGVDPASLGPIRCGVSIGTTDGETLLIERFTSEWVASGFGGFDASYMREAPAGRIPVNVAKELGLTGGVMTFATACAAGNYAIGYGYDLISTGEAACMLCGGADSLSRKTFAGFSRLNAVAPHICQPFDRGRRGLLTGEGAGILFIEARDRALARGARVYAEILGYGMSCDAVHMISPDRDSIASAFRKAHASAGVQPSEVDYVCAHGTGTRVNDQIESAAIAQVFGGAATAGQLDQVDDRPHDGRGQRHRGDRVRRGHPPPLHPADDRLRRARPGLRGGLRAQPCTRRRAPRGAEQRVRVRRQQRHPDAGRTVVGRPAPAGGVMTRLAITGCGVVSPIGIGRQAFTANWRAGLSGAAPVASFPAPLPCDMAARVPDFDPARWLGTKGVRCLDRSSKLAIVAAALALEDAHLPVTSENEARVGLVLGTSFGSLKSISDFTRESIIHGRPLFVNPMLFPNTVINCAAGQVAIWHTLKGINATVCGGQLSSLLALQYAGRAVRLGYADALLAGGVEEFCEQLAWSARDARDVLDCDGDAATHLGEGCALIVIEDAAAAAARGAVVLAEIVDWSSTFSPLPDAEPARDAQVTQLAADLRGLLHRAGLHAGDVRAVATRLLPARHRLGRSGGPRPRVRTSRQARRREGPGRRMLQRCRRTPGCRHARRPGGGAHGRAVWSRDGGWPRRRGRLRAARAVRMTEIVLTGAYAITSVGHGRAAFFEALCRGTTGVKRLAYFDRARFTKQFAYEIAGDRDAAFRTSRLLVCAARCAIGGSRAARAP